MQEFQGPLRSLKIKDMKAVLVITDVCGQQWVFFTILNTVTRAYLLHMQKRQPSGKHPKGPEQHHKWAASKVEGAIDGEAQEW